MLKNKDKKTQKSDEYTSQSFSDEDYSEDEEEKNYE